MKKIAFGLVGVFILALAVAVAKQLSSEAMAVIVGIVCGIGASIPTSMVMLYMLSRADERETRREPEPRQQAQPPVVIMLTPPYQGYPPTGYGAPRMIVGGQQYYNVAQEQGEEEWQ